MPRPKEILHTQTSHTSCLVTIKGRSLLTNDMCYCMSDTCFQPIRKRENTNFRSLFYCISIKTLTLTSDEPIFNLIICAEVLAIISEQPCATVDA